MADNLFTLAYWGLSAGFVRGRWPRPGGELVTGGSPRYRIYRTSDDRLLSVAPIEDRFWAAFCNVVELPAALRDPAADSASVIDALAEIIGSRTAAHWQRAFGQLDACVSVVRTLEEAAHDPIFAARGLFDRSACDNACKTQALPVPIARALRDTTLSRSAPRLGETNAQIGSLWLQEETR